MGKVLTLAEIRTHIASTTRESQINSLIDDYINLTLCEINDPAWAFEIAGQKGYNHLWSFLKRKYTLTTVASTEDYVLPRDVDKVALVRQTSSPTKISFLPDEVFYYYEPDPTAIGNPEFYRLWEEEGVATRLAEADTINVKSSSSSDITQTISIVGYDSNGIRQSEVLTLNGTSNVTGSQSFVANKILRISKSADTVGNITIMEASGGTTLVVLGKEERSPRFKVISFYPIPSSAISVYFEYYTRIRELVNAADVADIPEKWMWVVKLGTLEKVLQYQGDVKQAQQASIKLQYAAGVRAMVKADISNVDYIPVMRSHIPSQFIGRVKTSDSVASGFYGSGFGLTF